MLFLWKALIIFTLYVSFAKTGDSFVLTKRVFCRFFNRHCPPRPEVPVSSPKPATAAPGSNPTTNPTTTPNVFTAHSTAIPTSKPWIPGSVRRRAELLLSVANLANFIDDEIDRNPAMSVVRLDLELEYGLDLPALAAGKLAGASEHELVRVLGILTEVLSLLRNFPRELPERRSSSTSAPVYTTVPPGESIGGNDNEPPRSSSSPDVDSTTIFIVAPTIASTATNDSSMNSDNYTEPPSSLIAADDSPTTSAEIAITRIEITTIPQLASRSYTPEDDSFTTYTDASITANEINNTEPPSSSSAPDVDSNPTTAVKPTTEKPRPYTVFPTRADSGPGQAAFGFDYDYD